MLKRMAGYKLEPDRDCSLHLLAVGTFQTVELIGLLTHQIKAR